MSLLGSPFPAAVGRPGAEPDHVRERYLDGVKDALEGFLASPAASVGQTAAHPIARQAPLPAAPARPAARYLQVKDLFLVFESGVQIHASAL